MMLSKRLVKAVVSVFAVFILIVWGCCVYDVNNRLPQPKRVVYDKSKPVLINGLEINLIDNELYTKDEFKSLYPELRVYDDYKLNENDRFIVYEIKVKNTVLEDILFHSIYLEAYEKNSVWCNACHAIEQGMNKPIVEPGQELTIHLVSYVYSGSLSEKQIKEFKKENFGLAMSYYPEYITFQFK